MRSRRHSEKPKTGILIRAGLLLSAVPAALLMTGNSARATASLASEKERMESFASYVQEQDLNDAVVGFGDFSGIGEDGEGILVNGAADDRMQGMLVQMQAMDKEYGPRVEDKVRVISRPQAQGNTAGNLEEMRLSEMSALAQQSGTYDPAVEEQLMAQRAAAQTQEEMIRAAEQRLTGGAAFMTQADLNILRRTIDGALSGSGFPTTDWRRFGTELEDLGTFTLTAYDPCMICCGKTDGITATGTKGMTGRTIAVDPSVIPYGSRVLIGGYVYIAEDTGSAIVGKHIDLFMDTHEIAMGFGKRQGQVFLIR